MPIDTSIIGRLQPFQMQERDPLEQGMKRLQLMELLRQYKDKGQEHSPSAEMPQFLKLLRGAPAQSMDMGQIDPSMAEFGSMETAPAQAANPAAAYGFAMGSKAPAMQKIGIQGMAELPKLEAQQAERKENREWRSSESALAAQRAREAKAEQMQAQHAQRMDMLAANNASREQMAEANRQHQVAMKQMAAGLAAGMRQPPAPSLTTIVDPRNPNQMITVDARSYNPSTGAGVVGVSGKEPTALKREEQKTTGQEQVSGIVANLRDMYSQLLAGGGIVSSDKSAVSNIPARLSATGAGQFGGQLIGTKNQKYRDTIEQQRPLLLNAIKNATGMSAKQMDSNAEMKLYLAAATDPTKDIQANMDALDNLERLYGQGAKNAPAKPAEPKPAAPKPGTVVDGYRFKGGNPADKANWEKM